MDKLRYTSYKKLELSNRHAHLRLEKSKYKRWMENWRYVNDLSYKLITKTGYEAVGVKAGFISHLKKN